MIETRTIKRPVALANSNKEFELLTIEEIGSLLKISRSKAYSLIKEKDFPIIKIGRCIRVEKNSLLSWLHRNQDVI